MNPVTGRRQLRAKTEHHHTILSDAMRENFRTHISFGSLAHSAQMCLEEPADPEAGAPPVRTCWACGCTDDRACPGGCAWAVTDAPGEDLCTSCQAAGPQ